MANFNIPLPLDLRAILSRNSSVILSADQWNSRGRKYVEDVF